MADSARTDVVTTWLRMRGNGDIGTVIKHSLLSVAATLGFHVSIVNPEGFLPTIYSFVDYLLVCRNLYLVLVCLNVQMRTGEA